MGDDGPTQRYALSEQVDLSAGFEAAGIEYLEVNERRTVIIYRNSVIMLNTVDGTITAADEYKLELWEPSPDSRREEYDDVLDALTAELLTVVDATQLDE
ncbi:hypothetical protein [Halomicrobium salinisoli]|uniref:hypothetical protein n=1 Tax=Halomicrobium salinisoli TaxID=2878391 RepID=UPI001CF09979|nr:hypothetical protein [Halomicrobium salinisoli]